MSTGLDAAAAKMRAAGMSEYEIASFERAYGRLVSGEHWDMPEYTIEPVSLLPKSSDLPPASGDALARTAVLKLNGGIGTTMGLTAPKSSLEAHGGQSFLEIVAHQILAQRERYGVRLPFILLNSPTTHAITMSALEGMGLEVEGLPLAVIQGAYPRLAADTFAPIDWPEDPSLEWAPPGHGDVYGVLDRTGLLDSLLAAGFEYLFVSNIDNTGATISDRIATWFAASGAPFAAEVARRTPMDMKGGHFAARKDDGQIVLREVAQCPDGDIEFFQDISRHKFLNTNNLWISLPALRAKLDSPAGLELPLITNRKRINPKDPHSPEIIQLETAMGAAVALFEGSQLLEVTRDRFVPVKSNADLLLLRSDVFALDSENRLVQQVEQRPVVSLDDRYFKRYEDFTARVPHIPSLREATSLTVRGDVTIPPGYVATGEAILDEDAQGEGSTGA